jgi:HAD superfamily hydrolase (TIGR01457 family)
MQDFIKDCGFLLDMDGTIYLGDQPLPGALEFIKYLVDSGRPFCFFTNNSSHSRKAYERRLEKMGFVVPSDSILTSGMATILYLQEQGLSRVFLLGTPDLEQEFQESGLILDETDPQAVVLGFDRSLRYEKMCQAHRFLLHGLPYIATNPDLICPTSDGLGIPDCGAMMELFAASTGRRPLIIGKPFPLMAQMAAKLLSLSTEKLAIVGDRLYTDMEMGRQAGLKTILVLSGETKRHELQGVEYMPDLVLEGVGSLIPPAQYG